MHFAKFRVIVVSAVAHIRPYSITSRFLSVTNQAALVFSLVSFRFTLSNFRSNLLRVRSDERRSVRDVIELRVSPHGRFLRCNKKRRERCNLDERSFMNSHRGQLEISRSKRCATGRCSHKTRPLFCFVDSADTSSLNGGEEKR